MNIKLEIINLNWNVIYQIPRAATLVKGRKEEYWKIMDAAKAVLETYGCYAWGNDKLIYYIGSYSRDYKNKNHQNNFQERLHNYLQNHRTKPNGRTNTNKMVFDKVIQQLAVEDIKIFRLRFEKIILNEHVLTFQEASNDSEIIKALEEMLIAFYKKRGEANWNRT